MESVLLSGVIQGVYYALVSLGLVLVYRQSRILNFAHAAVATFSAYVAYAALGKGLPYWAAAVLAVFAGVALSLLVEALVVRPLSRMPGHVAAIGTIAVSMIVIGCTSWLFGTSQLALPPAVPQAFSLTVGSMTLGSNQVLTVVVTAMLVGAILLVLEYTTFGVALRAISEGPLTAQLLGVNVRRMGQIVWAASGALGAIAALLITPENYLDASFLTDFMITAFVAVVLGGLESVPGVVLGGILFGMASALFSYFVTERLANTFAFAAILVVLFVLPHGLLGKSTKRVNEPTIVNGGGWTSRMARTKWLAFLSRMQAGRSEAVFIAGLLLFTLLAPALVPGPYIFTCAMVAVMFLAVTSQNFVAGYSGQFTVGQSGFMVVGAYTSVLLQVHWGWTFLPAIAASAVLSGAVGLVLAGPAVRLTGVYLALLTIAFALALPELAAFPGAATGGGSGMQTPAASIFGLRLSGTYALYWMCVAIVWATFAVLRLLTSSPIARAWLAVRDSEPGAASIGFDVQRTKIKVFCIGAVLAGISGALAAPLVGFLNPENFTLWTSFFLLVAVIVGGSGSMLGSLIGAAFIVVVPVLFSGLPEVPRIAYGLILYVFLLLAPRGCAAPLLRKPVARDTQVRDVAQPEHFERRASAGSI
jgi:ABC-type branched-subunit amino acid transport system permease subunit